MSVVYLFVNWLLMDMEEVVVLGLRIIFVDHVVFDSNK